MKHYTYTYVTGDYSIDLTRAQAIKLLQEAKEAGYSCELSYSHYWMNRELAYAGSSGGFFFKKGGKYFSFFRKACVSF